MKYKITIEELRESTADYRDDDTYTIYEVKTEGDNSIVTVVQRTVLDYMEEDHTPPVIVKGVRGLNQMSNTDTNQASEDELRAEILTEFKQVHKLAPADYTENCTNVVMSIIRTEKLKLLAEVRERVVNEGELVDAEILKKLYDKAYSNGYNDRGYENSYNSRDYRSAEDIAPIIAKIRGGYDKRSAALTKLEAEL